MRCSMCGHDSPPGSLFCLNCGSQIAAAPPMGAPMAAPGQAPYQAPMPGGGLPASCPTCRAENPPGMKFCRNCGTVLATSSPGLPPTPPMMGGGPMGPPPGGFGGPPPGMAGMGGGPMGQPPPGMPPGGFGAPPPGMPPQGMPPGGFGAPPPGMPGGPMGQPPQGGFGGPPPGMGGPMGQPPGGFGGPPPGMGGPMGPPPGMGQGPSGPMGQPPPGMGPTPLPAGPIACSRCGSQNSPGFAFCQQCGMKLAAPPAANIDAFGGTLAATGPEAAAVRAGAIAQAAPIAPPVGPGASFGNAPTPAATTSWGSAVSVNRDGSDGERFPLASEFAVVGRAGADIAFDQDRFLARQHARIERTSEGARVVPMDQVNGVFRKLDAAVELTDGAIVLCGREVLRYEKVDGDERAPQSLVRHGVALFGSPPREPWGRLLQLLPSGGVRDVRHLHDDEAILGREEGDLVFSDDAFMSRRHAQIAWDGQRAMLADLGSSNGTFLRLNGPTAVKHGDHLRMGDQLFRIELRR
ncbi:MAG: FHA domain-containing protein [Deltaproteobacteria bacterium]|nr:FHA domain-containing protein [Deltaproteobacteria bacterium]